MADDDDAAYLTARGAGQAHAGPISGHVVDLEAVMPARSAIPAFVEPWSRLETEQATFVTLIHPLALVAPSAQVGQGAIICAFACVMPYTQLGRHVHVNVHSRIGHDSTLGDFCTLSAQVDITGICGIEDGVFFGSGAPTLPGVKVGSGCRMAPAS